MRVFVTLALTASSLIACWHTPTEPTMSPTTRASNPAASSETSIWHATSTVISVSATVNSCPVDHVVGQTRTTDWGIEDNPSTSVSILLSEFAGVGQDSGDYMSDPTTPVYWGSRTNDQFVSEAEQDGQPTCFVWHGDLTGSFSADGRTFDAVENIKYTHFGEDDMVVSRHWTGTRQ